MQTEKFHPSKIGFDFDGVIADTVEAFLRLACERYHRCDITPEDITHFSVEDCVAMESDIVEAIFLDILHDSVGTGLLPMPGVQKVMGELCSQGPITIITARPLADPVLLWLDQSFPASVCRQIKVVAMGDHDDKARFIKQHQLSAFVDDRAETCEQLHQEGIYSFVYTQPWNRGRHQRPSVHNWEDIRALCL